MAESKNVKKIETLNRCVSAKATAEPTQIGMIATLYIGGLMAASQSFLFARSIVLVVINKTPVAARRLNNAVFSSLPSGLKHWRGVIETLQRREYPDLRTTAIGQTIARGQGGAMPLQIRKSNWHGF
ncbi:MAG: hypothetical protein LH660_14120 [Phormidesmis sp. CAN_BIN36]|nr:hypothetical protein [Phormidesmis sp. CAN_BIN36]